MSKKSDDPKQAVTLRIRGGLLLVYQSLGPNWRDRMHEVLERGAGMDDPEPFYIPRPKTPSPPVPPAFADSLVDYATNRADFRAEYEGEFPAFPGPDVAPEAEEPRKTFRTGRVRVATPPSKPIDAGRAAAETGSRAARSGAKARARLDDDFEMELGSRVPKVIDMPEPKVITAPADVQPALAAVSSARPRTISVGRANPKPVSRKKIVEPSKQVAEDLFELADGRAAPAPGSRLKGGMPSKVSDAYRIANGRPAPKPGSRLKP